MSIRSDDDFGATFEADSSKKALILAKEALGEDAIILSVKQLKNGTVSVRAAGGANPVRNQLISSQIDNLTTQRTAIMRQKEIFEKKSTNKDLGDVGEVFLHWGFDEDICFSLGQIGMAMAGSLKERVLRSLAFKIDQQQQLSGPLPLQTGGVFALVGPTGTGKTTTIAKLAARAVEKWGENQVALISTDFYRIGAMEQLRVFAHLLELPLYPVKSQSELQKVVSSLKNKKLILIDTIGAGREDEKVQLQMQWLKSVNATVILAVQASINKELQDKDVKHWAKWGVREVLATKVDEVGNIKDLLNCCLANSMCLRSLTNGQRVPEDIHWVSGGLLAHKAIKEQWNDI